MRIPRRHRPIQAPTLSNREVFGGVQLLTLRADAEDEAALAQLEQVVTRHLERFAFCEQPEVAWAPTPGG
jgi:hypothetical protein